MPQLRKDPVTKRWVILLHEEKKLPSDFKIAPAPKQTNSCPFCPGNESKTPPELMACRDDGSKPNEPGWSVRVVQNRFPALQSNGDLDRTGIGVYDMMNGVGAHEVIIETPDHEGSYLNYSKEQIVKILKTYVERYKDLARDRRFRYILIFKNYGPAAGASLDHPHSQLIATPIVPKRVMEEVEGAKNYYYYKERCVFCDIVRQELSQGDRVIHENEGFVAFEPFASRFPFETWVMPKEHRASFGDIDETEIEGLAEIMQASLKKIMTVLDNPPFNFIIHTSPCGGHCDDYFHWHIEIMPRVSKVAGFEWGSGFYINHMAPERAAKFLINPKFRG